MYLRTPVVNYPLSQVSAPNLMGVSQDDVEAAAEADKGSNSELNRSKLKAIHWRIINPIYGFSDDYL